MTGRWVAGKCGTAEWKTGKWGKEPERRDYALLILPE